MHGEVRSVRPNPETHQKKGRPQIRIGGGGGGGGDLFKFAQSEKLGRARKRRKGKPQKKRKAPKSNPVAIQASEEKSRKL